MKLVWDEVATSVHDFIDTHGDSDTFPLPVMIECQHDLKEWKLKHGDVMLVSRLHSQSRAILRDASSLKFYSASINNPIEFYWLSNAPGKAIHGDKTAETLKSILNRPECMTSNGHIDLNLIPEFKDRSAVRDDDRSDHMPPNTFQFIDVYEAISLVGYHLKKDGETLVDDRLLLIPAFTPIQLRVARGAEEHQTQEELVRQMDSQFELPDEEFTMTLMREDFKIFTYNSKNLGQDFCFTPPEKVYSVINIGLPEGGNDNNTLTKRRSSSKKDKSDESTGFMSRMRKISKSFGSRKGNDATNSTDSPFEPPFEEVSSPTISSPIPVPVDEGYESKRSTMLSQPDDNISLGYSVSRSPSHEEVPPPLHPRKSSTNEETPPPLHPRKSASISQLEGRRTSNISMTSQASGDSDARPPLVPRKKSSSVSQIEDRRKSNSSVGSHGSAGSDTSQATPRISMSGSNRNSASQPRLSSEFPMDEDPYQDLADVTYQVAQLNAADQTGNIGLPEQPPPRRGLPPDCNRGKLPPPPVAAKPKPDISTVHEEEFPSDDTYVNLEDFLQRHNMKRDVSQLTQFQVIECLKRLKLDKHIEKFLEEEIDGRFLKHMDKQALLEIGFSNLEAVKLISFVEEGWKPTNHPVTLNDYQNYKQLMKKQ